VSIEVTPSLLLRLTALGLLTVIVQIAAVSQITILDANADLTPLVVAFAAFLCGSLPGAVYGFFVGLFLDLALVQTLGVSSLLLLGIGYGAGRIRELRDPQGALVPIAVGVTATAVSAIGFSIMQFMLGVDAPVSWELLGDIVVTVAINALIAIPVFALVRRWLTPALPEDPRRRRRRAYTTGGLSPLSRS
jgi:rod shape-determining protein MreD